VLARINAEFDKALRDPEIRAQLESIDNVPVGGTPAEFAKEIARATEQNRRLVETGGISTE